MKAIQASNLDSIDDYQLVNLPLPEPQAGEVRIKVAFCGVGYVDSLIALGRYQVKPALPHIPGTEVSGIIDVVPPGMTEFAVGDRVTAIVDGGFAELAIGKTKFVRRLPDRMSLAQGAGFRINYITALHGLRDRGALAPGETLLVFGATGGVGLAAIEIARVIGARIIAVASTAEKREFALSWGVDLIIDRDEADWRDRLKKLAPSGVDVVFDPACGKLMEPAFRSLRWRGRYLIVGFVGGDIPSLRVNLPLMKGASLIGVDYRQFSQIFETSESEVLLDEILNWVIDGRLKVSTGRTFELSDYKQALNFALSGDGVSKTLLAISSVQDF